MQLYEPSRLAFLWLIPIVFLFLLYGHWEWRRRLSRLGDTDFIRSRLMPEFSHTRRKVGWVLLVGVLLFSTIALIRPQWGEEKKKVERKGVDLVFLLDTSLSMLAEDIKPYRLGKSKLEIKNMIRHLRGDRVGMVAFAGSSFLQCPLTLDYSAFLLFVDSLKIGYIPNPGTSLSRAIELGLQAFPEESRKYRALIVLSDGEDHEGGMEQVIAAAKKSGVRIYTVGAGTVEGDPIPLRDAATGKLSGYKKDREGQVVVTRLNPDLLEQIARETGGLYLPATAAEGEVEIILKHLEGLGKRRLKERLITEKEEHFQLFLLIAFLLAVGETLVGNRSRKLLKISLPLLACFLFTGLLDSSRSLVQKGNRLASEKRYQSAVENYRKAEVKDPNEPVIRYNLGTALYHLQEYRDAEKELEQALARAKEKSPQAQTLYNYGNAKYRLGDFEKAIEAYKKVLDLNPGDEDAKYNLEFLQKKKSAFEKQHQERQQQKLSQNQQQNQQQQNQNQPQPRPQPQQQGRQDQQQPQPQQKQDQQQDAQSGQDQQPQPSQSQNQQQEGQQGNRQETPEQQNQGKERPQRPLPSDQGSQEEQKRPEEGMEKQEPFQPEEQPSEGPQKQPLQGQMSKENALRILDALRGGEKELQDLRRPETPSDSREPIKDW